ncbi:MAG: RtcB family protein, partial [Endomicrobia bacterium]|nr:RtcB family protein [Endomicrobiia bacterium]
MNLKKLDDYRYEVPQTGKMRVHGIVYATEHTIKKVIEDKAVEQVQNVATLPGIEKVSLAMPDVHWGYGFPIGGVAAFRISDGVISPGGIGYDINCLSGDTEVLHRFGFKLKIKDFESLWDKEKIVSFDFNKEKAISTEILRFIKFKPKNDVYEIETESGYRIIATEDHPFYTKDGMKELRKINLNEEVAVYPFEGVEYEKPPMENIVSEVDIKKEFLKYKKENKGNALKQILNELYSKNLLPLRYDSEKFPLIIKLIGYIFGDGNIHFVKNSSKGIISFWGKEEDLKNVKLDIEELGFSARIYVRDRQHKVKTYYKEYEFKTKENVLIVSSSSLALLLTSCGAPCGNKTKNKFYFPKWLFKAPLWQKRLFLSTYFSAEMSKPDVLTNNRKTFYCPVISINKTKSCVNNGIKFLKNISKLLNEFKVKTQKISVDYYSNNKKNCRIKLILSNETESLINLYSKIGFDYNTFRQCLSNLAVVYLKLKQKLIKERQFVEQIILDAKNEKIKLADLKYLMNENINFRFLERSYYEERKTTPRITKNFLTFDEFIREKTSGLGMSGMVWDKIIRIKKLNFDDFVYDFTVEWRHHNFVANNFVVSNCGVRLLRTNLTKEEIKPHLEKLIYALFHNIPSGVGSTGKL